nr:venom carboxylesterase-6-like [Leptinotarsa decemlineata]
MAISYWALSVLVSVYLSTSSVNCSPVAGSLDESLRNDLTISTSTGIVRGGHGGQTPKKRNIFRFRSIPYAEPPLGNLRFEPPVPKAAWSGVLDVRYTKPVCTQGSNPVIGSEDCLYLKIYTTNLPKEKKNLPVMVWIYGGAYQKGSPVFGDHSPDLLLDEGIILVSFHYRLGIFGFLSTGDLISPGNAGLKDQVLALKWIKKNIAKFGGDPNKITIFGQSAGAASIAYLLQTNITQGLFNAAIMHSGHSLSQWALTRNAPTLTKNIAKVLKTSTSSSEKMIEGLKKINSTILQQEATAKFSDSLRDNPLGGLPLGPVIEPEHQGAIITGNSYEKLKKGQFHHIPIIIGHTSREALLESLSGIIRLWLFTFDIQPSKLVPASMNTKGQTNNQIGRSIKKHYFPTTSVARSNGELMDFISDDQWQRPIQESVRLYSARTPVFYYQFSHIGSLYGITERKIQGVGHTEDLAYIFDFGHSGSSDDLLVRSRMVKMWTNFAKTGNPTPVVDPLLQNISWTANNSQNSDVNRLEISNNLTCTFNPNAKNINFWRDLFAKNGISPFSTY